MTTPDQLSVSLAGRYTVEREIGRGGMATVYLARDERHHRRRRESPRSRAWHQLDTLGADILYRQLAGDTTTKPIANTPFIETQMRLSPDGKWLAYVTTESGTDQVVVQPFPGPGARTQVSSNGGGEPVWSRDGPRIFYRDNKNFIAATVATTPAFAVTTREILFPDVFAHASYHADYDVLPDGQTLLLLRATADAQLMVVHNWLDEVRARLLTSPTSSR